MIKRVLEFLDLIMIGVLFGTTILINSGVSAAATNPAAVCDMQQAATVMGVTYSWQGACQDGLPAGRGEAKFPDGRRYFGDMVAGLFAGTGTLTLPGGERYTGEFAAGHFHGQGVYTFANGDRYVGEFRDGIFHGRGIYRKNGDEERYLAEYDHGTQTRLEVETPIGDLAGEPVLAGVQMEVLKRVAKVQAFIESSFGRPPIYTSGYRDAAKNAAVGGVLDSLHMQGRAVDLVVDGITPEQEDKIAAFAMRQGLWALWHGDGDNHHLHLQREEVEPAAASLDSSME